MLGPPQLNKNHSTFATHVKKEIYFNLPILQNKSKKLAPVFQNVHNLGKDPHLDWHYFDANPKSRPRSGSASKGKSDPDPDRHHFN